MPWRDLPERFGDGIKVHLRFSRWAKSGVWERVFRHLAAEADNEYAMIDSTIVRAHRRRAGAQKKAGEDQAIGRSRGGLSTKIHALVDALGDPIGFFLTGGEAHDLVGPPPAAHDGGRYADRRQGVRPPMRAYPSRWRRRARPR